MGFENQSELILSENLKNVTNVNAEAHGFVLKNMSIVVASVAFNKPFHVGQSPSYLRIKGFYNYTLENDELYDNP